MTLWGRAGGEGLINEARSASHLRIRDEFVRRCRAGVKRNRERASGAHSGYRCASLTRIVTFSSSRIEIRSIQG
jgi:hypothetical protein